LPISENVVKRFREVVGPENVLTSLADLAPYTWDGEPYSHLQTRLPKFNVFPDIVALPGSVEEVQKIIKIANEERIPITPRGAGTNQGGQSIANKGGMILDMSRMDKIKEINPAGFYVVVEPGVTNHQLKAELGKHNLFFPPEPASRLACTIGGMVGNDSSGMGVFKYGTTKDYVLGLQVVLPTGEVMRTGSKLRKFSTGYDLTRLFVGSEGTLGVVTEITLRVLRKPPKVHTGIITFDELETAVNTGLTILKEGVIPSKLELADETFMKSLKDMMPPRIAVGDAKGILFIEIDGEEREVEELEEKLSKICKEKATNIFWSREEKEQEMIWMARNYVGPAYTGYEELFRPGVMRIWSVELNDPGVPLSEVPGFIQHVKQVFRSYDRPFSVIGHLESGNVHVVCYFNPDDGKDCEIMYDIQTKVINYITEHGGTIAAEHGLGLYRASYAESLIQPETLDLMRKIKRLIDPNNIMNPGGKMALDETPPNFVALLCEAHKKGVKTE